MSTSIDYARPRRSNWRRQRDELLTRLCGLTAFATVALADTLTQWLYELGAAVVGVVS